MTTEHNIASAKYTLQQYCSVSALYCICTFYTDQEPAQNLNTDPKPTFFFTLPTIL